MGLLITPGGVTTVLFRAGDKPVKLDALGLSAGCVINIQEVLFVGVNLNLAEYRTRWLLPLADPAAVLATKDYSVGACPSIQLNPTRTTIYLDRVGYVRLTAVGACSGVTVAAIEASLGRAPTLEEMGCYPPVPSGIVGSSPAIAQWGQAVAVTAGATVTLASITSSTPGYQIKGFTANGIGDGYFFIQIGATTVLSGRIRSTAPVYTLTLPNGIAVPTGSAVTLKVTNESGSTADFEATLLGA